jgi:hypothetical protein
MPHDVCLEVVLKRVFPNNTHRAHLDGRVLPSICQSDRLERPHGTGVFDPPHRPQGGN